MSERIREFLEDCFSNAPKTQKAGELKEELFSNMNERFNDLIRAGVSEEKAYRKVVDNVGNIDELIRSLSESAPEYLRRLNERRRKTALFVCIAIAMYALSFMLLPTMVIVMSINPIIANMISGVIAAAATIMLIYYFMSRPKLLPPYLEVSELAGHFGPRRHKAHYSKNGAILLLVVAASTILFFVIGFMFRGWHWGWLVFLAIPVAAALIKLTAQSGQKSAL